MTNENPIAKALINCLVSVNVPDSNMEPANVVDVLQAVADAINNLAEAVREQGGRGSPLGK